MDPLYEQRLRDEVIYLHSLWHQGPPRAGGGASVVRHHLQPSKVTQFKKQNNHRGKSGKNFTNNAAPESSSSPWAEWPCPASPPSTTGWPTLEPKPNPQRPPLSSEEQSKLAAKHAQRKALKVVHEFFRCDDDSDAIDSSGDEDDELMEEEYGREEYSFFFKVFKEDTELREYYEKNFTKGEFSCLVCVAVGGKKTGKKFMGCLPLVQHSITIANTKKRRAHRAFGQAVCKVLGWDIDHLSAVVSLLSDKSNEGNGSIDNKESSTTFVDSVDTVKNDTLEGNNKEAAPETGYVESGISPDGDEGDMNSLMCAADADKNLENLGLAYRRNMEEPASQGLTINSLTCPYADKSQNLGIVYQHNVEQPAPEGLMINSLTWNGADRNLENLGVVHPHNVDDTASEWLRNESLAPNGRHHLQPSKATQFKKQKNRRGKIGKNSTENVAPESSSSPWAEWSCPISPPSTTGCPTLEPKSNPQHPPLSPKEQLKLAAKRAHHKALKVVNEFFRSNNDDDSDAIDSSSDEDDELMEEDYGCEDYSFFFKVFKEDTKLREYYETNFAEGEFSCLVCGALGGKKTWKKFKGCLPLVQHSITIANTKKRRAHRAFGQAVCKVLGWDIDHLSPVVSLLSDKYNEGNGISDNKESSMTFIDNVDSIKNAALEGKNKEAVPETGYIGSGMSPNGDEGDMIMAWCKHSMEEPASTGLTINSLMCAADADNNMEEPTSQGLTIVEAQRTRRDEETSREFIREEERSVEEESS